MQETLGLQMNFIYALYFCCCFHKFITSIFKLKGFIYQLRCLIAL